MIVGRSWSSLILIRSAITLLRSITPLSFLWIIIALLLPSGSQPSKYTSLYFLIEVLFYLFVFLPRKYYLQQPAIHPPLLFREERRALFTSSIQLVGDPESFLTKWFNGAELSQIKRGNVKQFYRWAFLNTKNINEDTEEEVEEAMRDIEEILGRKLSPGFGDAKCIRLSFDPVEMLHRPFVFYLAIGFMDLVTHIFLLTKGYQFYRSSLSSSLDIFPPRPQVFFTKFRSSSGTINYWFKPNTSTTKRPIIFIHGLGVGLGPYHKLLDQLSTKTTREGDNDLGSPAILAIEILSISGRMTSPILSAQEFCLEMSKILAFHSIEDFSLVGHSYGSVLVSQLLRYQSISSRIKSLILMDPISVLLLLPDVAYNFTRRKPEMANELQIDYFAAKDMGIAHTIGRHFFWHENIVCKEQLLYLPPKYPSDSFRTRNVTVIVSGLDQIIHSQAVAAYLTCPEFPEWDESDGCMWYRGVMEKPTQRSSWNSGDGSMRVVWLGDLDHGQLISKSEVTQRVTREILDRSCIKAGDIIEISDEFEAEKA